MSLPQSNEYYTYADYCKWDDGERWELVDGIPYAMSPAPSRSHRKISVFHLLGNNEYTGKTYGDADRVPVDVLPGCTVSLEEVFVD